MESSNMGGREESKVTFISNITEQNSTDKKKKKSLNERRGGETSTPPQQKATKMSETPKAR